jgi:hypothetical protein
LDENAAEEAGDPEKEKNVIVESREDVRRSQFVVAFEIVFH